MNQEELYAEQTISQTKLNKGKDHFLPRGYYTLFWLSSDMSSVKAQLHSDGNKGFPFLFGLCLATIGVCVFRCVASVTHFFILWQNEIYCQIQKENILSETFI